MTNLSCYLPVDGSGYILLTNGNYYPDIKIDSIGYIKQDILLFITINQTYIIPTNISNNTIMNQSISIPNDTMIN